MADDSENTGPITAAGVAEVNWSQKTITLPVGTIGMLVSIMLGAGGGKFVNDLFGTDQQVLDRITAVEARMSESEETQRETSEITKEIFEIVNAAHPPRGRVGVPSEND